MAASVRTLSSGKNVVKNLSHRKGAARNQSQASCPHDRFHHFVLGGRLLPGPELVDGPYPFVRYQLLAGIRGMYGIPDPILGRCAAANFIENALIANQRGRIFDGELCHHLLPLLNFGVPVLPIVGSPRTIRSFGLAAALSARILSYAGSNCSSGTS